MGLLEALKQYGQDVYGGALNPELKPAADFIDAERERMRTAQQNMMLGNPSEEDINVYLENMMPAGKAAGLAAHTVFHGSPFKFAKPSIAKVGKGEGNQAYGHGFYTTETRDIAEGYRSPSNPLLGKHPTPEPLVDGVPLDDIADLPKGSQWAHLAIRESGSPDKAWQEYLAEIEKSYRKDWLKKFNQEKKSLTTLVGEENVEPKGLFSKIRNAAAKDADNSTQRYLPEPYEKEALEYMRGKDLGMSEVGHLYKMDIPDADIPFYLDWDKPLSQQTPEIQGLLSKNKTIANAESSFLDANRSLVEQYEKQGYFGRHPALTRGRRKAEKLRYQRYLDNLEKGFDPTGEDLYQVLLPKQLFGKDASAANIDYSKVSDFLTGLGVKGNRYLDGNSRTMGAGTSNFVTFDPSVIDVLETHSPKGFVRK